MSKRIIFLFGILILGLFLPGFSRAVCPVCTIAVGAGVGLCRWLGIDDMISGVWVGGLIVSMIIWLLDWLDKKNIRFKFRRLIVIALFYFIVIAPLYWSGVMGHPLNKFLGMDKLLFGIICGSIAFIIGVWSNSFLKNKNQGRVFFPFQKVILPILFLIITSLIFYSIC
jgi:hypothetical protein